MPVSSEENKNKFIYYFAKLESIVPGYSSPYSLVFGDFKANVNN